MKSLCTHLVGPRHASRFRLLAGAVLFAVGLVLGPAARAITFTQTLPMPAYTTGTVFVTENNPTLGTFDFSATPFADYNSLTSISITLALYDLQTMATGSGQQRRDYNNISLVLGGVNTGLLLNGYGRNVGSTVTTTGTTTNGAAILSALAANGGMLTIGIFDTTASPSNSFDYFGGTASLSLTMTAVPFGPSSTLGFLAIGALVLVRSWPQLKRRWVSRAS